MRQLTRRIPTASLVLLIGLLAVACGGQDQTVPVPGPPPVMLRSSDGASQEGMRGSSCWSAAGRMLCGLAPLAIPADPLVIRTGESVQVDFSHLGIPLEARYDAYRYDESQWQRRSGARGPSTLGTDPGAPVRRDTLALTAVTEARLDLPPGDYALIIFSRHAQGDTVQGFHLAVR